MAVAQRYRNFAEREARGHSSVYESWAVALSDSPQALALIASLPTTSPASEDRTRLSEYRSTGCPVGVEPKLTPLTGNELRQNRVPFSIA